MSTTIAPPRNAIEDIYPLSPLQHGMLAHTVSDPGYGLEQFRIELEGDIDGRQLEAAWQAVVDRHTILRTSILWKGLKEPVQVVSRAAVISFQHLDWTLPPAGQESDEERFLLFSAEELSRGIELSAAPLMRLALIKRLSGSLALVWTFHHIIMDGWSIPNVVNEVLAMYARRTRGIQIPLMPSVPYRRYIEFVKHQDHFAANGFWAKQMRGLREVTPAPFSRGRASRWVPGGVRRESLRFDEDLTLRLQHFAKGNRLTLNTLVQGAWAILLSRMSGESKVVFGTTVSGRSPELEHVDRMIGLLINSLPLVLTVPRSGSLTAWLAELQAHHTLIREYSFCSLVAIQAVSEVPRGTALFQSLVVFENYPMKFGLLGRSDRKVPFRFELEEKPVCPVSLISEVLDQQLGLRVVCDEAALEADAPRQILTALERILTSFFDVRSEAVWELNCFGTRGELAKENWSGAVRDWSGSPSVIGLFEEQVKLRGAEAALRCDSGEMSFAQLDHASSSLARQLCVRGVGPEKVVAVYQSRNFAMIVSVLAIWKAGGAMVAFDASSPAERIEAMLVEMDPVVLLVEPGWESKLQPHWTGRLLPLQNNADEPSTVESEWLVAPGDLAYVRYTSGSTGTPKGVMVSHASLLNFVHYAREAYAASGIANGDSLLCSSLTFDMAMTGTIVPLCAGRCVRLIAEENGLEALAAEVGKGTYAQLNLTPSHLRGLQALGALRRVRPGSVWVLGGEALGWDQVCELQEAHVLNEYGPTEATVAATVYHARWTPDCKGGVPIGKPMPNTRLYVMSDDLQPVATGVEGELYIAGMGLARGYWQRPDWTADRFLPDPEGEPGSRMYRTGDRARWRSDGHLEYRGRNDDQVKIRGFRVELGEIETRLTSHPGVRAAVVLAREEDSGDNRLVAYFLRTETDNKPVVAAALRTFLSGTLPDYMVPNVFVALRSLPLNVNGKLDRDKLPPPAPEDYTSRAYAAPISRTEIALAQIWTAVLKSERVGRNDHFFELGGHSLNAMQVVTRLRTELRAEITLGDIFAYPVLQDFAFRLQHAALDKLPPITHADRSAVLPLSFGQQRLWFLSQTPEISRAYHIPLTLRLSGELQVSILHRALDALIARHEALRTTFPTVEGEPLQRIEPAATSRFPLSEHDLRHHQDAEANLRQLLLELIAEPFNMDDGPLVRASLLRVSENDTVVLLVMHHIVADGWSLGILREELTRLYISFLLGEEDLLPELPLQYADYAVWQHQCLSDGALQPQADYWQANLRNAPASLALPTDRPRPELQRVEGETVTATFNPELTEDLRALSRRHGATLYMTVLTAWAILLARLSGQTDLIVGTPVANRNRTEIEGLIGFFVNTLPLRLDLSGSPSVAASLARVKKQVIDAQNNQDIPFNHIVDLVKSERSRSRSPLFDVMFELDSFTPQQRKSRQLGSLGIDAKPFRTGNDVRAKFDMTLRLREQQGGMKAVLEYATALFDPSTAEHTLGYLRSVLEAMVANEAETIDALPLLSAAQRAELLFSCNATATASPTTACLHQMFEAQAEKSPGAPALLFAGASLSYGELNRSSNRLARYLRSLGVGPEVKVALCLDRGFDMMVGLLAVLKAGGAYVPLDPNYPAERLHFILRDTEPRTVLTQTHLLPLLNRAAGAAPHITDLSADFHRWRELSEENLLLSETRLQPANIAYVIYTSGSTGTPKGVLITHSNLANYLEWSDRTYYRKPGLGSPAVHSIGFDGLVTTLFGPLLAGQPLTLPEYGTEIDLLASPRLATDPPYTLVKVTPSHLKLFNRQPLPENFIAPTYALMIGGESLVPQDVSFWQERFPGVRLINHFGPTETTVGCCTCEITQPVKGLRSIPIGRPIANTQIYLLDPRGEPVPLGVVGEMFIGGAGVARGYHHQPAATADRFVPDPFSALPGSRMYRTGDLARRLPDGNLDFLGRNDFQVKVRGYRIELGEIEARLTELPGVQEAVVVVRSTDSGDNQLFAYIVGEGNVWTPVALRLGLSTRLPEYMIPVAFISLETLPLSPNGKIDRKALPDPELHPGTGLMQQPHDSVELAVLNIWRSLLGREDVGLEEDFFLAGGNSMIAVRMMAKLNKTFGIRLPATRLFTTRTVRTIAGVVRDQDARVAIVLVPFQTQKPGTPLFCVHPAWGEVLCFDKLAREIGTEYNFYAFQDPELSGTDTIGSIETMATRYITEMRTVQPEGPYRLAGYSFGGLVAFEMASQLERNGETVDVLALFDTPAPNQKMLAEAKSTLSLQLEGLAAQFGLSVTFDELSGLSEGDVIDRITGEIAEKRGFHGAQDKEWMLGMWALFSSRGEMAVRYRPTLYHGQVTLFRASSPNPHLQGELLESYHQLHQQPDLGWNRFCSRPLTVLPVAGHHEELMEAPAVHKIATAARNLLKPHPPSEGLGRL